VAVDQRLHQHADGAFRLWSNTGHSVTVDPAAARITLDGRDDGVRVQLLATFGLPLLLSEAPVLIVHASACWSAAGAVLICGDSGRGKSSALVGLLGGGWQAVSEDVCVIDLRSDVPMVWPGPPWVRRAHGLAGPPGATVRFETPDKVAWDVAPWQVDGPVPIAELIFLDEAGGDAVSSTTVRGSEAVPLLARHAMWLGAQDDRGRRLFGPAVDVTGKVPCRRVRFPISDSWLDRLLEVVA
jgi:hypothetical protein